MSGNDAERVASLWEGSALEPRVLDGPIGAASALKVAYAGWTKGSSALLLAMRAYAADMGVAEALEAEWRLSIPELPDRIRRSARGVGPKAWRFVGEMEQIAMALTASGLPDGFHDAAGEIYERIADLRALEQPTLEDAMRRLTGEIG